MEIFEKKIRTYKNGKIKHLGVETFLKQPLELLHMEKAQKHVIWNPIWTAE